jgi:hypothetical protein
MIHPKYIYLLSFRCENLNAVVKIQQVFRFQMIAGQPYCIQLTNDCLACKALQVSENLLSCRQLTTVSSMIVISWLYCIQLTDSGLVCDLSQVSKNLV